MEGFQTSKTLFTILITVVIAISAVGAGMAWLQSAQESNKNEIVCPVCGSPYVWTPMENYKWMDLECGHSWTETYAEDNYNKWLETFLEPEYVRDCVIKYLREIEKISLPDPLGITWTGGRETPEGLVGSETYVYQGEGAVVTIRYPVVLPENTIYAITVENQGETVWTGKLLQRQFTADPFWKRKDCDGTIGQGAIRLAFVKDIEILLLESFPVQIKVEVRGELPDSCTKVYEITTRREVNAFFITITTKRPADTVCAQVITPFEEVISLDVIGLKAGNYTVDVNGVIDTFELQTDNILKKSS